MTEKERVYEDLSRRVSLLRMMVEQDIQYYEAIVDALKRLKDELKEIAGDLPYQDPDHLASHLTGWDAYYERITLYHTSLIQPIISEYQTITAVIEKLKKEEVKEEEEE